VHGRHRRARARCGTRRRRGHRAAGDRAADHGRRVRDGDGVGDAAGRLVQADRQAHLPHGADPSSFRAQGLGRAEGDRAVLDHLRDPRAGRPRDPEGALSMSQSERSIVVGLGRTGLSCARFLHARHESFAVTDNRAAPPESAALQKLAPDTDVRFGAFDEALLDDANRVIASPGVSLREPFMMSAAIRGVPIIGDIELFAREAKAPIAAVTGTNGKSTVTTLVARMAEAAGKRVLAGGNLGRPALDLLDDPAPDLYVLELSSFQLDTTRSLKTAAAVVLNVTPDHMDRYESISEYASSKARIFQNCDAIVINLDDPLVQAIPHRAPRVLSFTLRSDVDSDYYTLPLNEDVTLMHGEHQILAMSELKISELHNVANALTALAMCDALQLPQEPCVQALREFTGLPHRSQWIADVRGVRYVNDS